MKDRTALTPESWGGKVIIKKLSNKSVGSFLS